MHRLTKLVRVILLLLALFLAACDALTANVATLTSAAASQLAPTADVGVRYTVIGTAPANARIEPVTIGPVFATFQPGDTVTVVRTIVGQTVGGSNQWRVIELDGRQLYIHSSRLQR